MSKWADPSPQLIQRFRILSGMTIAEAAEAIKTVPAVVCNWENGKHKPTAKSLTKLAKAYDRDVSDFYLVDIPTVRNEATSEVMGYFRNPDANPDRKASIASHLLVQLPERTDDFEAEPSDSENQDADLLEEGDAPKHFEGK